MMNLTVFIDGRLSVDISNITNGGLIGFRRAGNRERGGGSGPESGARGVIAQCEREQYDEPRKPALAKIQVSLVLYLTCMK